MREQRKAQEWIRTKMPVGSLESWGLAAAIVAIAIGSKAALDIWADAPLPPYITLYPAIVVAGFIGGRWVGVTAAWASLLISWYLWVPYQDSFVVADRRSALTLFVFAATGSFLGWSIGWARAAFDRAGANEAERAMAARESVHRIKNLIAVVHAMTHKIAREVSNVDAFCTVLSNRLSALGQAQDVLLQRDWQDADLQDVVQSALAPFLPNPGLKVEAGPRVTVPSRHISGLSIALYELSTNAMKYGALADGRGPVTLSWKVDQGACALEWREILPKQNDASTRSGFGTRLIQSALAREKGTAVTYELSPSTVSAEFRWPLDKPSTQTV
ncbi:MAG: HWE histidine kinase domain-containing protein [Caulobacterales bacterium]